MMQRMNAEKRRWEGVGQLSGTAEKTTPAGWECMRCLFWLNPSTHKCQGMITLLRSCPQSLGWGHGEAFGHSSSLVVGNSQCSSQNLRRYLSMKTTTPNITPSAGHAHDAVQVVPCFRPSTITTSRLLKIWHWSWPPGEGHLKVIASYTCGCKPGMARHCAYQKRGIPKEKCGEALPLLESTTINNFCLVAVILSTVSTSTCYFFFVNSKQTVVGWSNFLFSLKSKLSHKSPKFVFRCTCFSLEETE